MKNTFFKNTIFTIVKIYIIALTFFSVFRIILFFAANPGGSVLKNILYAFITGIRFDIVITGYIMVLPALLMLVMAVINKKNKLLDKILFYFIFILFSISFIISAADIPYFIQFFKRFDIGAFEWMDNPLFVFKMIIEEPRYFIIIIPLIFIIILFFKLLKRVFLKYENAVPMPGNSGLAVKILVSLVILLFIFTGIRGRLQKKSPIRIGTAYFCQNQFLNQLGLNAVFTFLRSYLDSLDENNKHIKLIDNQVAISNVRRYLGIKDGFDFSPIARKVKPAVTGTKKPNIVIIIMESMSAAKMKRFGNKDNLTPFLDSLSYQSLFFTNIYTAGEHTFNGIFSTLFSFPALYRQHPMKRIKSYMGIAGTLKQLGYSTTYFTTHDGQFDNVEGFLHANGFDNIFSQQDYPAGEIKTTLGVPDDYLFRFSIGKINEIYSNGKPFFVAFMTASDHGPYYIPGYFTPSCQGIKKQIVQYADWSLKKFISLARTTDWFKNTIFVFVADHGAAINVRYPIPLNYHHTPLLFYAPYLLEPGECECIGGQIDIFPTLMGIIQQPYINNTLGIDLLNEKRPYIFINGDDKVAALNNEFLFVLSDNRKHLYKYKTGDKTDYINEYPSQAGEMEIYLKSNLQTYQYMLENDKTLYFYNAKK